MSNVKVSNTSGLAPLGRAVLVEHYEPERQSSVIILTDTAHDRSLMVEQRAVVVEVGPSAWPNEPPRARAGDKVLIAKLAGYLAVGPADGKKYRLINDQDIFAAITHEADK